MYQSHIQLTPKLHLGELNYYWHIDQHTEDGVFTVAHGYSKYIQGAFNDMFANAQRYV